MLEIMTIPMQVSEEEYIFIIALPQESLDRLKQHDPAQLPVYKMGEPFNKLRIREIHIAYYDEQDDQKIRRLVAEYDIKGAIKVLTRGWKFRPELGDNDLPPTQIKPVN